MREPRHPLRGGVVTLVAILLVALFGVAALAVELIGYAATMSQARNYANLAALAALEEYSAFEPDTTDADARHNEKFASALRRANAVADLNLILSYTQADGDGAPTPLSSKSAPGAAELQPGYWFFGVESDGGNPCAEGEIPPCFRPYQRSRGEPNAFRVIGDLYRPVRFAFARAVFGAESLPVNVDRVAAIVPRRGCFLVDTSPSMVRETHLRAESGEPRAAEYAFVLPSENNGVGPLDHQTTWDKLDDVRPNGPIVDPLTHYKSDYGYPQDPPFSGVLSDADYGSYKAHHPDPFRDPSYSAPPSPRYRIDRVVDPEPLSTVMDGLRSAVVSFRRRAVVGDKMCLIFYDALKSWPRVVNLSDDYDYLYSLTTLRNESGDPKAVPPALRHGLFPAPNAHTNTTMAVSEALTQFTRAREANPAMPASDFIVVIGDGLTNCFTCDKTGWPPAFDANGDGLLDESDEQAFQRCFAPETSCPASTYPATCPGDCRWADHNQDGIVRGDFSDQAEFRLLYDDPRNGCVKGACSNTFQHYFMSMQELKRLAAREVYPRRIPIHVIMVGSDVGPHTVDYESEPGSGTCLSDYELRSQNKPGVKGLVNSDASALACRTRRTAGAKPAISCDAAGNSAFDQMSAAAPFYQAAADMYDVARMTGGIWAPLRACGPECECGTELAQRACQPVVERITTDPYCRTKQQQIEGYMEEIMGQNPFTVVSRE